MGLCNRARGVLPTRQNGVENFDLAYSPLSGSYTLFLYMCGYSIQAYYDALFFFTEDKSVTIAVLTDVPFGLNKLPVPPLVTACRYPSCKAPCVNLFTYNHKGPRQNVHGRVARNLDENSPALDKSLGLVTEAGGVLPRPRGKFSTQRWAASPNLASSSSRRVLLVARRSEKRCGDANFSSKFSS